MYIEDSMYRFTLQDSYWIKRKRQKGHA